MAIVPVHCPVLGDWCGCCVDCWGCVTLLDALEELGILEDTGWVCTECCKDHSGEFVLGGFYTEESCSICHTWSPVLQLCLNNEHRRVWEKVIKRAPEEDEPEVHESSGGYDG